MEATPEQAAEGMAIVRVLAAVLDRLVTANAAIAMSDPGQVTKFHAMKTPGIGVQQYLERYVYIKSRQKIINRVILLSPSTFQNSQVRVLLE
jgi:hypothetical protein